MLAQFHRTYQLAQKHSHTFLQWTEEFVETERCRAHSKPKSPGQPGQESFIDIIFWHSEISLAQVANKVQDWQYDGKPWAELIERFGCGSLVLVPSQLTDERYLLLSTPFRKCGVQIH